MPLGVTDYFPPQALPGASPARPSARDTRAATGNM